MSEDPFKERYLTERVIDEQDFVTRTIAVDRLLGREVLITHLAGRAGRRAAVQERFRLVARQAVSLSHANIIALYDIGSANGFPYAIQEHTHSESLREIIDHEGPFHPDDVSVLVEQVAAALDYAQLRGLPHLALSPSVITVDYDGEVLVSDFGIGQVLNEIAPTEVAQLRYRAPEQIAGEPGDHRSDAYALGVIAYEMLTGQRPFDDSSVETLRAGIMAGGPPPLSSLNPSIPPAISRIVLRAIDRDPNQRYESAGHFADALADRQSSNPGVALGGNQIGRGPIDPTAPMEITTSATQFGQTSHEPGDHQGWPRGTSFVAWSAVAVALIVLAWIGIRLLNDRVSSDDTNTNQAVAISPTTAPTHTAAAVPTAISLVGMTVDEARVQTSFQVQVARTEASDSVPTGQIIEQSPSAGQPVRTGELVVVVSAGPNDQPIQLAAMSVQGAAFDQVARQLMDQGVNVSQAQEGSQTVPEGQVIRIDEQTAHPGDTVHVVVSMGDRVQIPADLQSEPIDEAAQRLKDMGLNVGKPIAVSKSRIQSFSVDLNQFQIVDGDVVGIQEENAGFGAWVARGSTVTPVYYDESLTS
jgi:eukaryotic-like serine/threonine-protein kinase